MPTITVNDIDFAYLEDGPADGPLALCVHGFPDTAHGWRHLLPELAAAGYHAVAPFTRGYAPTGVAPDGAYQTGALAADVNALHEALGGDGTAVLIGHDWGAFAAYGATGHAPDRWRRMVTAAVPPMSAMATAFFSYEQIKRSFYIFFFQSPLADMAVPMNDLEFIAKLWRDWCAPGYDARVDVDHVRDALGDPAHLAAAIGYYRAMFDTTRHVDTYAAEQAAGLLPPAVPTLYLHGDLDGCLGIELTEGVEAGLPVPGSRFEVIPGAGHFLQLEAPEEFNRRVLAFLAE
jgi:pimeloyl-ACP methyl ester carboxylesterase